MKRETLSKSHSKEIRSLPNHGSICVNRAHTHPNVLIDGKRFSDFTSFDYFGLNNDPRVKSFLSESSDLHPWHLGSTRRSYGTSQEVLNLEIEIATWLQTKNAITFNSRNQAVFSLITNLVTERDLILVDIDSTAPVSDAAFQVGASIGSLDMTDMNWLENVRSLAKRHPIDGKVYCYFEEISSIHGTHIESTFAIDALKAMNIIPLCDITYSLGISSPTLLNTKNIEKPKEHFFIGSFGFSLPGMGAFIAGGETIDRIRELSSALLNEPALPPMLAKFNINCVYLLSELSVKSTLLLERSKDLRSKIALASPVEIDASANSPIVTLTLPSATAAKGLYEKFQSNSILSSRVSRGILRSEPSLVRLILSLSHKEEQLVSILRTLTDTRRG